LDCSGSPSLCRTPPDQTCATACAEHGHCEFLNCGGNLICCNLDPCVSPPGERCNCLEGGVGCTAVD
jgi:hypothetical protein